MKTQARAIPRLRNSSFVITSSVSQLLYSWQNYAQVDRRLKNLQGDERRKIVSFTWVRAKTLPENLQSAIISFTLFKAGMCSPLPCTEKWHQYEGQGGLFEVTSNLTWVNVKVERRIDGAGSPQTTVDAASEGDVGEN